MMMRITLILTVLLVYACNESNNAFDLSEDRALNEYYSKDEIKELERIIAYVDAIVCRSTGEIKPEKAYHLYCDSLKRMFENGKMIEPIENAKNRAKLIDVMDQSVFNSIWWSTDVGKVLEIRPNGTFQLYIDQLGKENELYKDFSAMLTTMGGTPTAAMVGYIYNHEKFDYNSSGDRLFAAIYFLTVDNKTMLKQQLPEQMH